MYERVIERLEEKIQRNNAALVRPELDRWDEMRNEALDNSSKGIKEAIKIVKRLEDEVIANDNTCG